MTVTGTIVHQIGRSALFATSGGRWTVVDENTVRLPVRYGYAVEVEYLPGRDLYEVRRTWKRGWAVRVVGVETGVYCDALPDAVYRAGCYHDPFGEQEGT